MPFRLTEKQAEANRLLGSAARHIFLIGGARSGKTLLIVRAIIIRALSADSSNHALFRFRGNAARASLSLDTIPKVGHLCFPEIALKEYRQDGFWTTPNDSKLFVDGLEDKERVDKVLGREYASLFLNECSQVPFSSVQVVRTRLAQVVQRNDGKGPLLQHAYYDLNPGGALHWSNMESGKHVDPINKLPLPDPENYVRMFIQPRDNATNLTPEFLNSLERMSAKQRKRFWEGEYSEEVDGALWTYERLDQCRVDRVDCPTLTRIIVAVDPSGARGEEDERSDEIGIIAAGLGVDGRCYILEDATMKGSPAEWGAQVLNVYGRHGADAVVYERNFGGAMVEHTLQTSRDEASGVYGVNCSYHEVVASRGKWVRAEPVSALYDPVADKVRHVGRFPELEDELCMFAGSGYTGARSPNRADALVWAVTFLLVDEANFEMNISDDVFRTIRGMSMIGAV